MEGLHSLFGLVSILWKRQTGTLDDKNSYGDQRYHEYRVRFDAEQERHAKQSVALRRYKGPSQRFEDLPLHGQLADQLVLIKGGTMVHVGQVKSIAAPASFQHLPLAEQLEMYHDKIKLGAEETKHAVELVSIFIGAIADDVIAEIDRDKPPGTKPSRIECTGSMYEGTKVGEPDEFDVMIVTDGSRDIESEEMTPGYARLRVSQQHFTGHRFSQSLDQYQNINPRKMLDWFYGLVQKGVNKLNIKEKNGLSIDVDIVFSIQLDQQTYYVAKPPDWSLACDPAMLWRQSFSVNETSMIARIDGDNECRRACLRILKSIFRVEPGLGDFTSFHLKTVVLRMCQEEDQWQSSKMGERFMDLLRRIDSCLRDRRLPHFYLPELNLLDGIPQLATYRMRGRILRLIDNKHERNRVLYAP
uniref:Uncharacterized protein n=1 Tax=Branchiostoma floridae TaxID=7739 RepID=C3YLL7_BRAFL|eukprot:XP_002602774.1 hypothetical protein BRAFLDRAFT_93720 [Branchiostoma floridae]